MPTQWIFCAADAPERATFASLATTLALPSEAAAEPNTNREVRRITTLHGVYFLKCFARTQWKNQLRNALTQPRCRLDAERELAVAHALEARGIPVARVVAIGKDRGASWYLCAQVPGQALRDLSADRHLLALAARFLGGILSSGVTLPDLALEHVFLLGGSPEPRFAIIDLHNGSLRPPRRKDLVRLLRRLARSARGLAISRVTALRFAARLLKAAGCVERSRAVLVRVPPFDTHGRYDVAGKSRDYAGRSRTRHDRELTLLRTIWPGRSDEVVLDLPCGTGRLRAFVSGEFAERWIGADRSLAMLREGSGPRVLADASHVPFADRAVDGVLVFRFLHHLTDAEAARVLGEAARVARRFVVVSFFHPVSGNALRRLWRRWIRGRAPTRHALWPGQVDHWMGQLGWRLHAGAADGLPLRDLRVRAYLRLPRA